MNKKITIKDYEVVVIGGGMSGVCAAIARSKDCTCKQSSSTWR